MGWELDRGECYWGSAFFVQILIRDLGRARGSGEVTYRYRIRQIVDG